MAADGLDNDEIAARLDTRREIVSKRRKRFFEQGLAGLEERPRGGRPQVFPPEVVWRWLCEDAIKPWRCRSWMFPRYPDFDAKAAASSTSTPAPGRASHWRNGTSWSLPMRRPPSRPRIRCQPTLAPASTLDMRVEHEYDRGGALGYLAAWDVHRARVFGRCEPTTGIEPFGRLVDQVMTTEPYASARRVFWVVDNGSSHRGQAAVDRMRDRWPNARLVQLPVHASWLNQVEIYFLVVQRKVLTPNDFADLAEVESRLLAFERRYEQTAAPFEWRFTRSALTKLLERLADKPDYPAAA
jgi:hypothetical protein